MDNAFIEELISQASEEIVNHIDPDSDTALMAATRVLNSEAVFQLLKRGADPNLANEYGYSPLYQAVCFGGMSLKLRGIIQGIPTCRLMQTHEVFHRSLPIIKSLVSHGASVNAEDADGETALKAYTNQFFKDQIDPEIVTLLLELGAKPLSKSVIEETTPTTDISKKFALKSVHTKKINNKKFWSQLQRSKVGFAIQQGNAEMALEIIRSGKRFPWIENKLSNLTLAIKKELSLELIRELISRADATIINYADCHGDTALLAACRLLNSDVVLELLKKGAEPDLSNTFGYTPLYTTVCFGEKAIPLRGEASRYALDGIVPLHLRLHMFFQSSLPLITALITSRASIDARNNNNETILEAYVNQGKGGRVYSKMVTLLVRLGANPSDGVRRIYHKEFSPKIAKAIQRGLHPA